MAIEHFEVTWGGFLPATADSVARYLVEHAGVLSINTLKLRLSALAQWHSAQQGLRGNASWVPPTYALALWTLGRKDEAVKWYAAAVRTEPQRWSTSTAYAQLLPTWRDSERASLAEVQQAWAAQPPAWP